MSGGGNTGLGDIEYWAEKIANVATNYFTAGLVGYGDGSFKQGVVTKPVVSGFKEISGAKAAEDANKDATARFEEEKKRVMEARAAKQVESDREQVIKSRLAGQAQVAQTTSKTTPSQLRLGSDEQDYLGL